MILDATAGNRVIWRHKNSENIIYIDIEKRLEVKPTIFADNTNTPFLNATFDTIFYDPPYIWRRHVTTTGFFSVPNPKLAKLVGVRGTSFYGVERYKNKAELIAHIHRAQNEFRRILKDEGLLWFKWNEANMKLTRILTLFNQWTELICLYIKSPLQTMGKTQTYWVCLCKKQGSGEQTTLDQL